MFLFSFDIYLFIKSLFISIVTHSYLFPTLGYGPILFYFHCISNYSSIFCLGAFSVGYCVPLRCVGFGKQVNFVPLSVVFALLLSSTRNKATYLFLLITHQISENICLYTFSSSLQTKHSPSIPSTFLP